MSLSLRQSAALGAAIAYSVARAVWCRKQLHFRAAQLAEMSNAGARHHSSLPAPRQSLLSYLEGIAHKLPVKVKRFKRLSKAEKRALRYERRVASRKERRRRKRHAQNKRQHERRLAESQEERAVMGTDEYFEEQRRLRKERELAREERLAKCLDDGQKVVVDLSYTSTMSDQELRSLSSQLVQMWTSQRRALHPASLHVTSFRPPFRPIMERHSTHKWQVAWVEDPVEKVFDRERLVFLSPDADEVLGELSSDDVYVIGGIVDRSVKKALSATRGANLGVRMARLPLREHIPDLKKAVMNVNVVFDMLITQQETGDWATTVRKCVPVRHTPRDAGGSDAKASPDAETSSP